MIYQVVVRIDPRDLAMSDTIYDTTGTPLPFKQVFEFRQQVFTLGEVIICDEDGREIVGKGRKAYKWYVEVEEFLLLSEAVRRARKV